MKYKIYAKKHISLQLLAVYSVMSRLCDPWAVARQAPLSVGFSRQEYWSGLPLPCPKEPPPPHPHQGRKHDECPRGSLPIPHPLTPPKAPALLAFHPLDLFSLLLTQIRGIIKGVSFCVSGSFMQHDVYERRPSASAQLLFT